MSALRTDIENIPTDGTRVLIGTMDGEILISYFRAADKWAPNGKWNGLSSTGWPIAWAPIPTHPYFPDKSKPLLSGERA